MWDTIAEAGAVVVLAAVTIYLLIKEGFPLLSKKNGNGGNGNGSTLAMVTEFRARHEQLSKDMQHVKEQVDGTRLLLEQLSANNIRLIMVLENQVRLMEDSRRDRIQIKDDLIREIRGTCKAE